MPSPSTRPVTLTATLALAAASLVLWPSPVSAASAASGASGASGAAQECVQDGPPVPLTSLVDAEGDLLPGSDRAEAQAVTEVATQLGTGPGDVDLADIAEDPAARVNACGDLSFVDHLEHTDHTEHTSDTDSGPAEVAHAAADVFALHSRPGAKFTIFLDFDGATLPGTNQWAVDYNQGLAIRAAAWSLDSDPGFSDAERAQIHTLWRATADAYAPFEIDVTTEQPAAGALERSTTADDTYGLTALISPLPEVAATCGGCSGVAFVNIAQRSGAARANVQPALAFQGHAQTIIHELGHNFGLRHHTDSTSSYHSGDAAWTPIMGSGNGHYQQWNNGDFPQATNTTQGDLAVIAGSAPLRVDDHTDTTSGATAYGTLDGHEAKGAIERRGDADRFSFTASGDTTITVDFADRASLRGEVTLLDAAGNLLQRLDTLDSSRRPQWQQASTRQVLAPGRYQVRVRGVPILRSEDRGTRAFRDRTDYGSLGSYAVRIDGDVEVTPLTLTDRRTTVRFTEGVEHRFVVGTATGGVGPYRVTCDAPTTLVVCGDESGGRFLGQPQGTYTVPWTLTDGRGETTTGTVQVIVRQASVAVVSGVQSVVEAGTAATWTIATTGPASGYSVSASGLPGAMVWRNGAFTGTLSTPGTWTPTLVVTLAGLTWPEEKAGATSTLSFSVRVLASGSEATKRPTFVTKKTLGRGKVGKKYTAKVVVASTAKVSWKRTGAAKLPKGLTWKVVKKGKRTSVRITGRPKQAGTFKIALRASNAGGARTKTFVVKVARR